MNPNQSLYGAVAEAAKAHPDHSALLFMGKSMSYSTLIEEIDATAAGLKALGVRKGDVITVCMPNIFEGVYAFYAGSKIGAICHMVHPLTPVKQMEGFLKETESHYLFILDSFHDTYAPLLADPTLKIILCNPVDQLGIVKRLGYRVINRKRLGNICLSERVLRFRGLLKTGQIQPEDSLDSQAPAVYLHSGGTSGKPKTIELSSFAINTLAFKVDFIMGETDFTGRTMLAVLPMFHGFGLCMGIHAMLCFGGTDALMPKFSAPDTIELIKSGNLSYIIGVPTLFEALLSHPDFAGSHLLNLRQAYVGGDFVSPTLKLKFDQVMQKWGSQARLLEGYGLTEMVTVVSVNTLSDYRPDSVGRHLSDIDIKIVDLETRAELLAGQQGEIALSGPTRMIGYYKDPEATEKTFLKDPSGKIWVLTGDYGFLAPDGHLHFKQRLKRIVKVSGMPVMPSEIETLVTSIDGVAEAAAIGIDDLERGHMIKLFIRLKKDAIAPEVEFIKRRIKEELSIYAVPKAIEFLAEMPHTVVGKIDMLALEARENQQ